MGLELMEACVPLFESARPDGYLVATYGLAGVLAELIPPDARRGRRMLPSGSGSIRVRREGEGYVVAFDVRGDDLFRPADAGAITGELRFAAGS